jgi:hypothetical protein
MTWPLLKLLFPRETRYRGDGKVQYAGCGIVTKNTCFLLSLFFLGFLMPDSFDQHDQEDDRKDIENRLGDAADVAGACKSKAHESRDDCYESDNISPRHN